MIETNLTEIFRFTPYPALNFTIESLLNATQFSVYVALNNSAGLGDYNSPVATGRTNKVGELYTNKCNVGMKDEMTCMNMFCIHILVWFVRFV